MHVHRSTKWVTNLLVQKIKDWQEILKRQKTSTLITALWYTNLLVISNPMRFRSKHKKNYIINPPKFPNCNKHTGHKPHFWVFFPNMIWMTSFFSMHDLNDLDPSSAIWFFVPLPPPAFPADCVSKTHLQKRKKSKIELVQIKQMVSGEKIKYCLFFRTWREIARLLYHHAFILLYFFLLN